MRTSAFRVLLPGASVIVALCALQPTAAALPAAADVSATSLVALQRQLLGPLTGDTEIAPGVKLTDRFSTANKEQARTFLEATMKASGVALQRHAYNAPDGVNLYAVIPCGRPNAEAVILGAHYDSVRNAPGANDDGTGVAAVVAVAREMAKMKTKSRDLIVVLFDQEERGLLGSKAFAQKLKDENRIVHSAHTIDQMGWDQNHNRAIEIELPYDGAVELYQKAAKTLKMKIEMFTTTERGSDHDAFRRAGFKAVGLTEEYHHNDTTPFYHKPGDTFATVDFDYLANSTRLVLEVMRELTR